MKLKRISPNRHDAALRWVNDLILDLKLIELGEPPHKPIDMVRLAEWQAHRRDIEECNERVRFS